VPGLNAQFLGLLAVYARRDGSGSAISVWGSVIFTVGGLWLWATFLNRALHALRRRRALAMLAYVEQAMRLKTPLPEFLAAAALGESRPMSRLLLDLKYLLVGGAMIPEAVQVAVPALPPRAIDLIVVGYRNGTLPQSLGRILAEERSRLPNDDLTGFYLRWYAPLSALFLAAIFSLLSIYVMPKYRDILRDYHLPLPWSTRIIDHLGAGLAPLIAVLLAGWTLTMMMLSFVRLIWPSNGWQGWHDLKDTITWHTPLLGAAVRGRALADVMNVIADSLAAGRPVDEALSEASSLHVNRALRAKIGRWADAIQRGEALHQGAKIAGMAQLVCGTLAIAQFSGDPVSALHFLERYYRGRYSRMAAFLRALGVPILVVSMGAIVLLAALALFEPLLALMDTLSPYKGGL
jgi:type II secretory pathway component PulF